LQKLGFSSGIEANKGLYEVWVEKKSISTQNVLCRMGQLYAKITPDGNAFRCCAAVNKDWGYLGNLIDGSFNLMDQPIVCTERNQNCVCFKAMVIGEENNWYKHWGINDIK
jgi:hypothetical protein